MDTANIQITVRKDDNGIWAVKDFVVLHQPEPWSPETFSAIFQCVCHLHEEPPEFFTWPHRPLIRVAIVRDL